VTTSPTQPSPGPVPSAPDPARDRPPADLAASDLRSQLALLWRYKWLILVIAILAPAASLYWTSRQPDVYNASALVQVEPQRLETYYTWSGTNQTWGELLESVARLTTTTRAAQVAARKLDPPRPPAASLAGSVSALPDSSGFVRITATDGNARRAAAIANAFAEAVRDLRAADARSRIVPAMAGIRRAIAELPPSDQVNRTQLQQQLQQLRVLARAAPDTTRIVESATTPGAPAAPRPIRSAVIAFILGTLAGIVLAFLLAMLDRRIRDPADLERLVGAPLLAVVPLDSKRRRHSPGGEEAFETLRASLTHFRADGHLMSVAVCSPVKGEGKTTVATNLARALVRARRSVILVDADMRNAQVATRLGTEARGGLADVLEGETSVEGALVQAMSSDGDLRVLASGPYCPNPSVLLASSRMRSLLVVLHVMSDLVIIDTPPTLQVSDAIPLFDQVSGVVLVGRLGRTRRDAVRRMMSVVETAGGRVLGVVATTTKSARTYGYGYYGGYGYRYGYGERRSANGAEPAGDGAGAGNGRPRDPERV
jgi:non-specific protein-tyrosine kinase